MEWPWEWNLPWNGIGVGAGIVIALASLVVSVRSHKASERSARASEISADAAKRAVAIQEREHFHSRVANLLILNARTYIKRPLEGVARIGGPPPFHFLVRNTGGSEAFDLSPSISSDLGLKAPSRYKKIIGPSEEAMFGGYTEFDYLAIRAPDHTQATFTLSYQDDSGSHMLTAVFELTFERGKAHEAIILSVMLDGKPHHQHPGSATA